MPGRDSSDTPLTQSLRRTPPALHGEGEFWGIAWEALEWLEANVVEGMTTLETGAGASTIVFTARGATHEAVTPDPAEEERIRRACRDRNIDDSRLTFHIGRSQDVLPTLPPRDLDLVLVDGAHGFPYPVLDWWHLAPRLKMRPNPAGRRVSARRHRDRGLRARQPGMGARGAGQLPDRVPSQATRR